MSSKLWQDASKYFRGTNGQSDPPFAANCRLAFYMLGEWTINDVFTQRYSQIVLHYQQAFNTRHADFIHDHKRGRTQGLVAGFQKAIERQGPNGAQSTLQQLLTDGWEANGSDILSHAGGLKRLGILVPFNHIDRNGKSALANLFAANGFNFLGHVGAWKFKQLLTESRRPDTDHLQRAVNEAKRLGVLRPLNNPFGPGEDPSMSDQQSEEEVRNGARRTPRNGKCCQAGTGCIDSPNADHWCELQDPQQPYNQNTNTCNVSSDVCP